MSMKDASWYAVFEAMYDYVPADSGELELKVGDQCFVLKPVGDPQGWLEGVNTRSKEHGQFPGTYCKILDHHAAPPRPKKPPSVRGQSQIIINGHTVEKIFIIKPIWCFLCDDYIWGGGKVSLICSGCLLCSHAGCHQLFNSFTCSEVTSDMVKPKKELQKSIRDWMPDEVLEWMVAGRLHPYIHLIHERQLFGKDLEFIDEKFLSELGITFSFHIQLFKICIEELMKPAPTAKELAATIPLTESKEIQTHVKLHDHTFTTLQVCHICGNPMLGIFRQGIMCAICGMQCHRPCAFRMRNRQCTGANSKQRRSSVSDDPSFCCNFNTTAIPPVMKKCVEAVEEFGLTTYNVYSKQITYEQFQFLKSALNQNPDMVNMRDEYWNDPGCAAQVLKTFLLELPMPLLPLELYDEFVQLAITGGITRAAVSFLWGKLPDANRSHLDYLLKHLIKLSSYCNTNGMTLKKIARQFSFLIVRPRDNEASKFISNLDYHEKILYQLLSAFDQLESTFQQRIEDFESEKWLWTDGTRKDASQCLRGNPDGTFLVRPSEARRGEWTLTVRKEGKDRLIKIITRDGFFGFREDLLRFKSLKELVFHFREHSLKDYNDKLDVKLITPCGKPETLQIKDEDKKMAKERLFQLSEKLKEIRCIEFKVEEQYQQLEECKSMSESQTDMVNFLEEQISLAELQFHEASSLDRQDLQQSLEHLNKLLLGEKTVWKELDERLSELNNEYNQLKAQMNELSTELPLLREEYNQLEPKMKEMFPEEYKEEEDEDIMDDAYDYLPTIVQRNDLEEKYWLFGHLEKQNIQTMLENKPDGTFLVRKSLNYPYVISLVHDGLIKHIPILKGQNGYGFAEPHNTYKSLNELINHYHNQSLRLHNRNLDTTLRIPYRFLEHIGDEPIYD